MPCHDGGPTWDEQVAESRALRLASAGLCAVLTVLDGDDAAFAEMLKKIDWKEAGLTKREFLMWWETHKEEDRVRREREAKVAAERKLREQALAKLTPQEKKILGVK